jgi:hypothetical protein
VFGVTGNIFLSGTGLVVPVAPVGATIGGLLAVFGLIGAVFWVIDKVRAAEDSRAREQRVRAVGRIRDRLGEAVLYANPPRFGILEPDRVNPRTWPLTPDVTVSVEAAGNASVTRGRNLAAKAIGGALVPGGVFLFGNAKNQVHDHRELYLIIDGPDWAYTLRVDPNSGEAARRFAQNLRLAARQAAAPEAPRSTPQQD